MSDNPLELLRKKRGWKAYRMAQELGLPQTSYAQLIKGVTISSTRLKLVAEKLNLTDKELRDLIENWQPVKKDKAKPKNSMLSKILD